MKNIHQFDFQNQRITVKMPKSYFRHTGRFFPAIFVQDGDYLFENVRTKKTILIGIESKEREKDYTPWAIDKNPQGGGAKQYLEWLVEELIPHLKQYYRVSHNHCDYTIAGASYGGLVSLYALLHMPEQFGNYILISPSMWYSKFIEMMESNQPINFNRNVYWYVGGKEGIKNTKVVKPMLSQTRKGYTILNKLLMSKQSKLILETNENGIHRPKYFKKYFKRGLIKLNLR